MWEKIAVLSSIFFICYCDTCVDCNQFNCSCEHCYLFINDTLTFEENYQICANNFHLNGTLLTLLKETEFIFVQNWLRDLKVSKDVYTSAANISGIFSWISLSTNFTVNESWIQVEPLDWHNVSVAGRNLYSVLSHDSSFSSLRFVLASGKFHAICQTEISVNARRVSKPPWIQINGIKQLCEENVSSTTDLTTSTTTESTTTKTTSLSPKTITTPFKATPSYGVMATLSPSIPRCTDGKENNHLGLICPAQLSNFDVSVIISDVLTKVENTTLTKDDIEELNDRIEFIEDKLVSEKLDDNILLNLTEDLFQIQNFMLDKKNKDAWTQLDEAKRFAQLNTLTKSVQNTGHLIGKHAKRYVFMKENIYIQIEKLNKHSTSNMYWGNWINATNWDVTVFTPDLSSVYREQSDDVLVVGVLYKTLHTLKKSSEKRENDWKISSPVFTLTFTRGNEKIQQFENGNDVVISLPRLKFNKNELVCGFWNESKESNGWWDTNGCRSIAVSKSHVNCSCSHLTSFALLMDITSTDKTYHDDIEFYLTVICCTISIVCELTTAIIFHHYKALRNVRTTITKNLCVTLSVGTFLVLIASDKTENQVFCSVVAGIIHYVFLCAFAWMSLEGYHLYLLLVRVFQRKRSRITEYYVIGYGFPAAIVAISASVHPSGYGTEKYCWLSSDDGFIWAFLGPVAFVIVLNTIFLVLAVRSAISVKTTREVKTPDKIRKWIRGSFSLSTLLGITWVFGYLNFLDKSKILTYIFVLLNALQGLFIFIFHCVINENVQQTLLRHLFHHQKLAWLRHRHSSTTPSKTSLKTRSSDGSGKVENQENAPANNINIPFSVSINQNMMY